TSGFLSCSAGCTFDTRGCSGYRTSCGDGVANGTELCDGNDFRVNGIQFCNAHYPNKPGSDACGNYCLGSGVVTCRSDCTVDISECAYPDYCAAADLYNDGTCDDCEPLGGTVDPDCAVACGADGYCADWYNEWTLRWTCQGIVGQLDPDCSPCGDGQARDWQYCDGADLRGATCRTYSFGSGTLACAGDCTPDFANCHAFACGDGVVDASEHCEGADLGGAGCAGLGFSGGALACGGDCLYDVRDCGGRVPTCGNGVIDAFETCDGALIGVYGPACADYGMGSGLVRCTASCAMDFGNCSGSNLCGTFGLYSSGSCDDCEAMKSSPAPECTVLCGEDGVCADYFNSMTGQWTCQASMGAPDPDCGTCGNGTQEGEEWCDGDDWYATGAYTCRDFEFAGGTLGCLDNCMPDFSRCFHL
ncbi:MAG: hypothetical protein HYZ27_02865, partial [Deltaproteobacteria bacterium]|nr:hypothetical protein [Deltaproteobacteria bacterium]